MDAPYRTAPVPAASSQAPPALGPIDEDLRPSSHSRGTAAYWLIFASALVLTPVLAFSAGAPAPLAILATVVGAPSTAWLFDRLVLARRALKRFNAQTLPLAERLSRGHLDEVEAAYRALMPRFRGRGGLEAILLFNIAAVRTRRGDSKGALRILDALYRYRGTRRATNIVALLPSLIALHWAQLGEVAEARRWLDRSRTQKATTRIYTDHIEAMVLIREGRYAEAEAAYQRVWPDLERILPADAMRSVIARRAFALDRVAADPAMVRRWVDAARPSRPDELQHLGCAWDELRTFLEKNRLI